MWEQDDTRGHFVSAEELAAAEPAEQLQPQPAAEQLQPQPAAASPAEVAEPAAAEQAAEQLQPQPAAEQLQPQPAPAEQPAAEQSAAEAAAEPQPAAEQPAAEAAVNPQPAAASPAEVAETAAAESVEQSTYTLAELQSGIPPGVDKFRKEEYLSDDEFLKVFKMTKEIFRALPNWKKTDMKKKEGVKLF